MSDYSTWLQAVCQGVVVNPQPPPQFTANPTGGCVTAATQICHTCAHGTITGYRYRPVGATTWTTVTA